MSKREIRDRSPQWVLFAVDFDDQERVHHYRFVTDERSLVQPVFNRFINLPLLARIPRSLAPNVITLLGHAAALAAFAVLAGLSDGAPRTAALAAAVCLFVYCVADSVDGLHARRIGASSPLGDFLDHGLDALAGFTVPLGAIIAYGGTPTQSSLMMAAFALGWWSNNLSRVRSGVLVLPPIGAMEANFLVIALHLLTVVFGPAIWQAPMWGVTPLDVLVVIGVLGFLDVARTELPRARREAWPIAGMALNVALAGLWPLAGVPATASLLAPLAMGLIAAKHNGDLLRHYLLGTRYRAWDPWITAAVLVPPLAAAATSGPGGMGGLGRGGAGERHDRVPGGAHDPACHPGAGPAVPCGRGAAVSTAPARPGMPRLFLAAAGLAILANAMLIYGLVVESQDRLGLHPLAGAAFAVLCLALVAATLPAGLACDRHARLPQLLGATAVLAALAAATAWPGLVAGVGLLIAAAGLGAGMGWLMTARLALVGDVSAPDTGPRAMAALTVISVVANGAGPMVAGLVRETAPGAWVFAVAAVLLGVSLALAAGLRPRPVDRGGRSRRQGHVSDLRAGFVHVATRPALWGQLGVVALTAFLLLGPFHLLMPAHARRVLGLGEAGRGLFLGLICLGFLLGGWVAGRLARVPRRAAALAPALAASGTALLLIALAESMALAVPALLVLGVAGAMAWSLGMSALQAATEPAFAGRVMGLYLVVQPAFSGLGGWTMLLLAGVTATGVALAVAGACLAAAAMAWALWSRMARRRLPTGTAP